MKISIKDKIKAYECAIDRVKNNNLDPYICVSLQYYISKKLNTIDINLTNVLDYFPELLPFKSNGIRKDNAWWTTNIEGNEIRIKVINQIISNLNKLL